MKYIELLRRLLDLWSQKSDVVAKWVSARHCLGAALLDFVTNKFFYPEFRKKCLVDVSPLRC